MHDSSNRLIDYLRISVTDRCNLRCTYCMPPEGVEKKRHDQLLSLEDLALAARAAASLGVSKIRLTGGEPLVRHGIVHLVSLIAAIPAITSLGMTTNGTLLAPLAAELKAAGLMSINISLDTLDPGRYRELTRGGDIREAIAGVQAAAALGFPLKINMVVFPETTPDEIASMRRFAESLGARLQRIAAYTLVDEKQDGHGMERPPKCATCNRIRLTSDGMLRPCLRSSLEVRFDPKHPEESIRQAVLAKPPCGGLCDDRTIAQIGG